MFDFELVKAFYKPFRRWRLEDSLAPYNDARKRGNRTYSWILLAVWMPCSIHSAEDVFVWSVAHR